jgi:hypothetical protein
VLAWRRCIQRCDRVPGKAGTHVDMCRLPWVMWPCLLPAEHCQACHCSMRHQMVLSHVLLVPHSGRPAGHAADLQVSYASRCCAGYCILPRP